MWAVIKNNAIDSIIPKATTVTIDDITYGKEMFSLWSDSERWEISIKST